MFEKILSILSRLIQRKYNPLVIGVTGSVGKTTTIAALESVFRASGKRVRATPRSCHHMRAPIVASLGCSESSLFIVRWWLIVLRALSLLLIRRSDYPEVLLVEYGVKKPGDMDHLLGMLRPSVAVITAIVPIGLERFESMDRLTREMMTLAKAVPLDGWVVLAGDDPRIAEIKSKVQSRVVTYGLTEKMDVRGAEIHVTQQEQGKAIVIDGTHFKFLYHGSVVPAFVPGVLGGPHVHAALAAAAVAVTQSINLVTVSEGLRTYKTPPGRMSILRGIKHTLIVDDTYDGSHASCAAAIVAGEQLRVDNGRQSFAVLGEMEHFGGNGDDEHEREIARDVVEGGFDYLVTVGRATADINRAAREAGMPESNAFHFEKPEEAGKFLKGRLEEGDVVYVTGKKAMRMEELVRMLLAEPNRAGELLVQRD